MLMIKKMKDRLVTTNFLYLIYPASVVQDSGRFNKTRIRSFQSTDFYLLIAMKNGGKFLK